MLVKPIRIVLLVALAGLFVGCDDGPEKAAPHDDAPAPPAGWALQVLDAEALAALRRQTAADGQVLVIDCWATWCSSCRAMFPLLHEAMAERGEKVRLISLCFDENSPDQDKDYIALARDFLAEQHAWEDAYLAEAGEEAKAAIAEALGAGGGWGGGALPAVFVYDTQNKRVHEMIVPAGGPEDWVAAIAAAVDAAAE